MRKVLLGYAAVDSGQLMVTDPCYVHSFVDDEPYGHPALLEKATGIKYVCDPWVGQPGDISPKEGAIIFKNYGETLPGTCKTFSQAREDGDLEILPKPSNNSYSYSGACNVTTDNPDCGGQLMFEAGHAGAGVVFSTGYGDGRYPVYAYIASNEETGDWGERVFAVVIDMALEAPITFSPEE